MSITRQDQEWLNALKQTEPGSPERRDMLIRLLEMKRSQLTVSFIRRKTIRLYNQEQEDVIQEAVLKTFDRFNTLELCNLDNPAAWFWQVARNNLYNLNKPEKNPHLRLTSWEDVKHHSAKGGHVQEEEEREDEELDTNGEGEGFFDEAVQEEEKKMQELSTLLRKAVGHGCTQQFLSARYEETTEPGKDKDGSLRTFIRTLTWDEFSDKLNSGKEQKTIKNKWWKCIHKLFQFAVSNYTAQQLIQFFSFPGEIQNALEEWGHRLPDFVRYLKMRKNLRQKAKREGFSFLSERNPKKADPAKEEQYFLENGSADYLELHEWIRAHEERQILFMYLDRGSDHWRKPPEAVTPNEDMTPQRFELMFRAALAPGSEDEQVWNGITNEDPSMLSQAELLHNLLAVIPGVFDTGSNNTPNT